MTALGDKGQLRLDVVTCLVGAMHKVPDSSGAASPLRGFPGYLVAL